MNSNYSNLADYFSPLIISYLKKKTEMLDAGQDRSRWWPPILVLHLHSGSVGPASRVDFGQFYKIIQYIISYMYIYMYYNQPSMSPTWDVMN